MSCIKEGLIQKGIKRTSLAEKIVTSYKLATICVQIRTQLDVGTFVNILNVEIKELIISKSNKLGYHV